MKHFSVNTLLRIRYRIICQLFGRCLKHFPSINSGHSGICCDKRLCAFKHDPFVLHNLNTSFQHTNWTLSRWPLSYTHILYLYYSRRFSAQNYNNEKGEVLIFELVDDSWHCDHSNENYWLEAVLSLLFLYSSCCITCFAFPSLDEILTSCLSNKSY